MQKVNFQQTVLKIERDLSSLADACRAVQDEANRQAQDVGLCKCVGVY